MWKTETVFLVKTIKMIFFKLVASCTMLYPVKGCLPFWSPAIGGNGKSPTNNCFLSKLLSGDTYQASLPITWHTYICRKRLTIFQTIEKLSLRIANLAILWKWNWNTQFQNFTMPHFVPALQVESKSPVGLLARSQRRVSCQGDNPRPQGHHEAHQQGTLERGPRYFPCCAGYD